jgi:hypothetical protein
LMDRYIGGLDIARWFSTKISRQINLSKPQKEGDIQRIRLVDNEARVHGVECGICLDGDRQGVVGSDDFCGYIRIVKEITKALALHREGAAQGGQVGKLVASDHRPDCDCHHVPVKLESGEAEYRKPVECAVVGPVEG